MLDHRTTLLVTACLYILLPLLMLVLVPGNKSKSVWWWCLGGLLAGSAILLIGARNMIADWMSFHLANTLIACAPIAWIQSLRHRLGRSWRWPTLLGLACIPTLFYAWVFSTQEPMLRSMLMRLLLGIEVLLFAAQAFVLSRQPHSGKALPIAWINAVLGIWLIAHALLSWGQGQDPSPFAQSWNAGLLAFVALLTASTMDLCFMGILLDHAGVKRLQAARDVQRQNRINTISQKLAHMENQQRWMMMTGALAHEINQPMTAINAQAEMGLMLVEQNTQSKTVLASLFGELSVLIERANAVLQRIRQSTYSEHEPMQVKDLRESLHTALQQLKPLVADMRGSIILDLPDHPVMVRMEPLSLSQVLVNLMRNGLQAMQNMPSRSLLIALRVQNTQAALCIEDEGNGFDPDILVNWGSPFLSTRKEGLGMGLALSRITIKRHNGRIEVSNRPEGGARIRIYLPLSHESH